jgi:osmotically inducible lipoprotein OsmB
MRRKILSGALLGSMASGLAGCGDDPGDRAVSGGLIGAGGGAAIAAMTGGAPLAGAAIGGAVGAVGGAVTSGNTINLGRPIWR